MITEGTAIEPLDETHYIYKFCLCEQMCIPGNVQMRRYDAVRQQTDAKVDNTFGQFLFVCFLFLFWIHELIVQIRKSC